MRVTYFAPSTSRIPWDVLRMVAFHGLLYNIFFIVKNQMLRIRSHAAIALFVQYYLKSFQNNLRKNFRVGVPTHLWTIWIACDEGLTRDERYRVKWGARLRCVATEEGVVRACENRKATSVVIYLSIVNHDWCVAVLRSASVEPLYNLYFLLFAFYNPFDDKRNSWTILVLNIVE